LSFINPLFLIAITGALVPIIIHLTKRFRARKIKFSSLIFLKASPKELVKKRRLQDLILLIVRSIIFALLAFTFARPFFPQNKIQIFASDNNRSIVLLVDNSYSTQYTNVFDQIKNDALEVLNNSGSGDEFSVVFFSDEARQITSFQSSIVEHKNAIENRFEPTYRTTDLHKPLQFAEEILQDAKNPSRQIIMISDFQNIGFGDLFDQWKLDPDITFIPQKIEISNLSNNFVNKFEMDQNQTGNNNIARYQIEILSEGTFEKDNMSMDLFVDNQLITQRTIQVEPIAQTYFQQEGLQKGNHQGYFKTVNDKLNVDNYHFFTFNVEELPSILCIDDSKESRKSDSFFLKSAFDFGEDSNFRFTSGNRNQLNNQKFHYNDLVFLTNTNSLSNRQIQNITNYVSNGGNLFISFGDLVSLNNLTNLFKEFKIGAIEKDNVSNRSILQEGIIGLVDFKHPIFSLFVESGANELYRPKFRKYIKIQPDSTIAVLGKYDSGSPFLLETKYGMGKVLVYTSTFNTSWSDFPIHDIYVPFLYQLANYSITHGQVRRLFLVGESIPLKGNPNDVWKIIHVDGRVSEVVVDETGLGLFREANKPGNYLAKSGDKKWNFSVNVNVTESNLETRNTEEVLAIVSKPDEDARQNLTSTMNSKEEDDEKDQKLWLYLILLVILLFIFETYFANKSFTMKDIKKSKA